MSRIVVGARLLAAGVAESTPSTSYRNSSSCSRSTSPGSSNLVAPIRSLFTRVPLELSSVRR